MEMETEWEKVGAIAAGGLMVGLLMMMAKAAPTPPAPPTPPTPPEKAVEVLSLEMEVG